MKKLYRDPGNQAHMFLAMYLLALFYLAFLTILWAAGVKDLQKWYPMGDIPI